MKSVANSTKSLDAPTDGMSDHNCEYDDLDYLLRDILRREETMAPEPRRGFAALRRRLMRELQPLRMPWSLASPDWPSSYMSVSYWYFEPLSRVMR